MFIGGLALALCQDAITWTGPADRLERLLPALGKEVGRAWKASPGISGEIVFVRIRDADPDVLQEKLAECLDAEWESTGGTLFLVRRRVGPSLGDLPCAKELAHAAIKECDDQLKTPVTAAAVARITDDLARSQKEGARGDDGRPDPATQLERISPGRRLILRLIQSIGEDKLREALKRPRTVFAARPNRAQEPLPASYPKLVSETQREFEGWQSELSRAVGQGAAMGSFAGEPVVQPQDIDAIRLVVANNSFGSYANMDFVVKTTEMGPSFTQLHVSHYATPASSVWQDLKSASLGDSPEIKLSEAANREVRCLAARRKGLPATQLDDAVIQRIQDPVTFDPTSGFVSECLAQWAETVSPNVIAIVPDSVWSAVLLPFGLDKVRVKSIDCALHDPTVGLQISTDGDWTLAKMGDGSWNRWSDRTLARETLAHAMRDNDLGLDDRAAIVYGSVVNRSIWLQEYLYLIFAVPVESNLFSLNHGYVVWGCLNQGQRKLLRNQGRLAVQSLNAAQKRIVERMVYEREFDSFETGEGRSSFKVAGQQADPTEVCPDGLPPGSFLSLDTNAYPRIFAYGGTSGKPVVLRVFDRIQAARWRSETQNTASSVTYNGRPVTGFAVANETVSNLKIVVGDKWWHSFQLTEKQERPKGKPVPWDQLPEDVRKPPSSTKGVH